MKKIKILSAWFLALALFASCSDEFEDNLVKDNLPEIPVTYAGATTAGFNPYYSVQYAGTSTPIQIVLSIPSDASLQIKEVTKMIAGATAINAGNLTAATQANYLSAPIAVNGFTATINTTIGEFNTKVPASARITAAPAAGTFTERAFMFLLTMQDDSQIIPVQCRIRVTP